MRRVWFGYTATSIEGKGSPGLYYDDLPNEKNYLHAPFLAPPVEITDKVTFREDGEVALSFYELQRMFPPPAYDPPPKLHLDSEESVIMGVFYPEVEEMQDKMLASVGH